MVINNRFFETIDSSAKAYWVGFITADGNLHRNRSSVQLNLSAVDLSHLQKLALIFGKRVIFTQYKSHGKICDGCYLSLCDKTLWESLNKIGVVPNKTITDQSPIFRNIPTEYKKDFIRGLFDGDGSIAISRKQSKNMTFSIAGEHRLLKMVGDYIVQETGISQCKINDRRSYAVIRWSGAVQCTTIYDFLHKDADIFLERKDILFKSIIRSKRKVAKYHGVTKRMNGKFNAAIHHQGKRIHIGLYDDIESAAFAYDQVAIELKKPLYKINFKDKYARSN